MWMLNNENAKDCEPAREELERIAGGHATHEFTSLDSLLDQLPQNERLHASGCAECQLFAKDLLELKTIFAAEREDARDSGAKLAQPGPFFMARVMAAIKAREAEEDKSAQTWAAVPRLAHRLTLLASLTLLVAGGWLYERPTQPNTVAGISAEQNSEGLVEGSSTAMQDDFVLNTADR
jgi:hypothetical protein